MIAPSEKDQILNCLQDGTLTVEGRFMWGSNYTFLCNLEYGEHSLKAVYKPTQGERPLWDFPGGTLAGREVAAFLVSEAGGWHLVPPTIFIKDGPSGAGSLQYFIDHDPERHYFNFSPQEKQQLSPVALFDAVINNTDRKGGHVLVGEDGQFWLIDHGISFHTTPKLRTVIWDFAGQPITDEACKQLETLGDKLQAGQELNAKLLDYLSRRELQAMLNRINGLLDTGIFPRPVDNRYSYPWPPV